MCDWCSPSDLGHILRTLLRSVMPPEVDICVKPMDALASREYNFSELLSHFRPDLIFAILDVNFLTCARELCIAASKRSPPSAVIFVVEEGEPAQMFGLLRLGAVDFVTPPLKSLDILPRLWRLLEQTGRQATAGGPQCEPCGLSHIVGKNSAFLVQLNRITLAAHCDSGVLIRGETGTGKELFACSIHQLSARALKPFVAINCGAIPSELAENELFGHERGAFTGANVAHPGMIQEAEGGTLFLDEIGSLHPSVQAKLLRFLQDKEYRPLGAAKARKANVRIIGATNLRLETAMLEGTFRKDLYYRLSVIPFILPSLTERYDDVALLARHFLAKHANALGKPVADFSPETLRKLQRYHWPGNVRELEHVIERAVVFCTGAVLLPDDLCLPGMDSSIEARSFSEAKAMHIAVFEKAFITELLGVCRGNITHAARLARKSRRAFFQLIRKHQIEVRQFKRIAKRG